MTRSSTRTYNLYEQRGSGRATPHWQFLRKPKVYGCSREDGYLSPPIPTWEVRAGSVTQACWFANESVTSLSRDDGLGVWIARERWHTQENDDWGWY